MVKKRYYFAKKKNVFLWFDMMFFLGNAQETHYICSYDRDLYVSIVVEVYNPPKWCKTSCIGICVWVMSEKVALASLFFLFTALLYSRHVNCLTPMSMLCCWKLVKIRVCRKIYRFSLFFSSPTQTAFSRSGRYFLWYIF